MSGSVLDIDQWVDDIGKAFKPPPRKAAEAKPARSTKERDHRARRATARWPLATAGLALGAYLAAVPVVVALVRTFRAVSWTYRGDDVTGLWLDALRAGFAGHSGHLVARAIAGAVVFVAALVLDAALKPCRRRRRRVLFTQRWDDHCSTRGWKGAPRPKGGWRTERRRIYLPFWRRLPPKLRAKRLWLPVPRWQPAVIDGDFIVTARLVRPRRSKVTWSELKGALDVDKGTMCGDLGLSSRWGTPVQADVMRMGTRNPAQVRTGIVVFRPLPRPEDVKLPDDAIATGKARILGLGYRGWVCQSTDLSPHLRVVAPTGGGKAYVQRTLIVQDLRAGNLTVKLDGGNSPEHRVLDDAPTVLHPIIGVRDPIPGLLKALTILEAVQAIMDVRSEVNAKLIEKAKADIEQLKVSGEWAKLDADKRRALYRKMSIDKRADWPRWLRRRHPRIKVSMDELTLLLMRDSTGQPARGSADWLRDAISVALAKCMRLGRKFGVEVDTADQATHASTVSTGTTHQATSFVLLGKLSESHQRMTIDEVLVPPNEDQTYGVGVAGVRMGWAEAIVIPSTSMEDVAVEIAKLEAAGRFG